MKPKIEILHILEVLRERITAKYTLVEMRLFGSTARGDSRIGSDIDVFVCLPEVNKVIEEELFDIAYDVELDHNCLIDIIVVSEDDLRGQSGSAPIFEKILSEGIAV